MTRGFVNAIVANRARGAGRQGGGDCCPVTIGRWRAVQDAGLAVDGRAVADTGRAGDALVSLSIVGYATGRDEGRT